MTDLALEKRQHRRLSVRRIVQRGVFITIGALLMAVGLEIFLIPNQVIDGGVTGVSIMLSHITGIKLGIFLFILNLPFVYLGYKQFGKTFAISTIYGIIMLSLFATFFHPVDPFTDDILLATMMPLPTVLVEGLPFYTEKVLIQAMKKRSFSVSSQG